MNGSIVCISQHCFCVVMTDSEGHIKSGMGVHSNAALSVGLYCNVLACLIYGLHTLQSPLMCQVMSGKDFQTI